MNSHVSDKAPAPLLELLSARPEDAALRRRLIDELGARNAWLCHGRGADGATLRLAFVVPDRPLGPAALDRPDLRIIPITSLPRRPDGGVDATRLAVLAAAELAPAARAPAFLSGGVLPPAPAGVETLGEMLRDTAARFPDHGIGFLGRHGIDAMVSYAALHDRACLRGAAYRKLGLAAGDPVILGFDETEEEAGLVAFWGALYAGLVPVPVLLPRGFDDRDPLFARLQDTVALFDGATIACPDKRAEDLGRALPGRQVLAPARLPDATPLVGPVPRAAEAYACFFLTSGSTTKPKIVGQSHHALLSLCRGIAAQNAVGSDDISLTWLPMDHVASISMMHLRDVSVGARQYRAPCSLVLQDPLLWLDWLSDYRVTNGWAPNFAFGLVCAERARGRVTKPWDLSRLRYIANGGEAVIRGTARRFYQALAEFGLRPDAIRPVWGMSETCSGCVFHPGFDILREAEETGPVAVGYPAPGLELRIVDAADPTRTLCQGETGILEARGPMVLGEYHRNPKQTAESLSADGWFGTGDLAKVEAGLLYLLGRKKDVLVVNGQNIDPGEAEMKINALAGVRPAFTALVDLGADTGEAARIAVFFVPDGSVEPKRLLRDIRRRLGAEMGLPVHLLVPLAEAEVPKTSIGKIQKEKLRAGLRAGTLVAAEGSGGADRTAPAAARPWKEVWRSAAALPGGVPSGRIVIAGPGGHALAADPAFAHLPVEAAEPDALVEAGTVPAHLVVLLGCARRPERTLRLVQTLGRMSRRQPLCAYWLVPGLSGGATP